MDEDAVALWLGASVLVYGLATELADRVKVPLAAGHAQGIWTAQGMCPLPTLLKVRS